MWNIFEYPFVGVGIALAVMIGLWIFGAVRPDKRRRWHPFVPLGIVVLSFAVCFFVRTDREKILAAAGRGVKAFETQNIGPIKEIIADDYSDLANPSKEYLIAYCQALFQTSMMKKVTMYSRQTQINGDRAEFTTSALVQFAADSEPARMGKEYLLVKAKFHFKKTPQKRWLIYGSEILELDRKPINWNMIKSI